MATCLLLLDRFENPDRSSDFEWEWDECADIYRSAPAPIRSALMNGFEVARQYDLVSEQIRPTKGDLTTYSTSEIIAPLLDIARALTNEERAEIATADYGCNIDKHRSALDALLNSADCRFHDSWFPTEVVSLVAYVSGATGFEGCSALILANAIYNNDNSDSASYRWQSNKFSYLDLPLAAGKPIISAFRHLYETITDWDPFFDTFAPERLPLHSYIPWNSDKDPERPALPKPVPKSE
ncbi:hypothetical protein [Roseovarius albus]|uniref:hypothetical protein n=1 Tax=Roseovarius albus TaxID=1247867 RepID=UPI00117A1080|nr:hypothetical protein [Roseovarius albus]